MRAGFWGVGLPMCNVAKGERAHVHMCKCACTRSVRALLHV